MILSCEQLVNISSETKTYTVGLSGQYFFSTLQLPLVWFENTIFPMLHFLPQFFPRPLPPPLFFFCTGQLDFSRRRKYALVSGSFSLSFGSSVLYLSGVSVSVSLLMALQRGLAIRALHYTVAFPLHRERSGQSEKCSSPSVHHSIGHFHSLSNVLYGASGMCEQISE